jgi:MFS family permease
MNAGRTVFQEKATPATRGRVLSVYTLGFMGASGLVGAPLAGFLAESIGPLGTCFATSGAMFVLALLVFATTEIRHVE